MRRAIAESLILVALLAATCLVSGADITELPAYPDSPRPVATWHSTADVVFSAHPQQASTLARYTLQDGVSRTAALPLTWDPSTGAVDGGLDTGSLAASTWYYVYLVPATADVKTLALRGSVTAPPTGPTGYANMWRYVGAVYSDADSHLRRFSSNMGRILWVPAIVHSTGSASDTELQSLDLTADVPATAVRAVMRVETRSTDVAQQIDVWGTDVTSGLGDGGVLLWVDDAGVPKSPLKARALLVGQSDTDSSEVPISTATVYYQRVGDTDGGVNIITVLGYRDGY